MGLVHVLGPVDHGALLEALSRLLAEYSTAEMKEINVGTVLTEVIEGAARPEHDDDLVGNDARARVRDHRGGHCPGRARHQRHRDCVEARHRPAGRPEVSGDAADRSCHDERRLGRGLGEVADSAVEHVGDARPRADQGERRHRGVLAHSGYRLRLRGAHLPGDCCRRGCFWARLSCAPRPCSRSCSACPCSACSAMWAPSCWAPTRCSISWSLAIAF